MKTEGKCRCGWCEYLREHCKWVLLDTNREAYWYCSHCGYHLADDGFAFEMVRADRAALLEAERDLYRLKASRLIAIVSHHLGPACPEWDTDCKANDPDCGWCHELYEDAADETDSRERTG